MTDTWALLGHPPRVSCVGVYIVDVLGRVIEHLPRGQTSVLIDQIALTVAGTAGGVAVNLARLGARVGAVGVVGSDTLGDFLCTRLREEGVDTALIRRVSDVQTSATILPIDSSGARPAFHVIGANGKLGESDIDRVDLEEFDVLHLGGVTALSSLDGEPSKRLLRLAHESGLYVSMDMLGVKRADAADLVASYLPWVDVFTPNDSEALAVTGCADPESAATRLHEMGVTTAIVTCGPDGAVIADRDGVRRVPAPQIEVVDTTGCGDALTSGILVGRFMGWSIDDAVRLGVVAASLTASGLGSDAGIESLEQVLSAYRRHHAASDLDVNDE